MKKRLHLMKKMSQKKLGGFTLIELMIAMAIIAILATAGIQAYTGYIKKSRDTARAEIAHNLNTAVLSYAASNNGLPPASVSAFDQFLQSAGSTFGVSSSLASSSGVLVVDPVGGKEVCLDADGEATEPCAFHYTAYTDGTYAISYGVEHETSTQKNFYKTTDSVAALTETTQQNPGTQATTPKYGVYTGTARYIGQASVVTNGTTNDGIDVAYVPPGAISAPAVAFRSITMNVVVSGGGGGNPCDELGYFSGNITLVSYDTQMTYDYGGAWDVVFSNIVGVDGNGHSASVASNSFQQIGPSGQECGMYSGSVICTLYGSNYVDMYIEMSLDGCSEHYDASVEASFEM